MTMRHRASRRPNRQEQDHRGVKHVGFSARDRPRGFATSANARPALPPTLRPAAFIRTVVTALAYRMADVLRMVPVDGSARLPPV